MPKLANVRLVVKECADLAALVFLAALASHLASYCCIGTTCLLKLHAQSEEE